MESEVRQDSVLRSNLVSGDAVGSTSLSFLGDTKGDLGQDYLHHSNLDVVLDEFDVVIPAASKVLWFRANYFSIACSNSLFRLLEHTS